MDRKEILTRIGQIRQNANLSARKLSMDMGRNPAYINGLESKSELPTIESLLEIIETCGSNPTEFFYYNISAYKTDREIIELLQRSTPERKAIVLDMLKVK